MNESWAKQTQSISAATEQTGLLLIYHRESPSSRPGHLYTKQTKGKKQCYTEEGSRLGSKTKNLITIACLGHWVILYISEPDHRHPSRICCWMGRSGSLLPRWLGRSPLESTCREAIATSEQIREQSPKLHLDGNLETWAGIPFESRR